MILFAFIGLFFDQSRNIPGSFKTFMGNILVVDTSYNGAWWFVVTYLFLLILSPLAVRITKKLPAFLVIGLSGVCYVVAYVFRFQWIIELRNPVLNWCWQQVILFGTSQLPYMIGMIAFECHITETLRKFFWKSEHRLWNYIVITVLPLLFFAIHCVEQSLILAPVTAMAVLVSLFLTKLPTWADRMLAFMGKHSTNVWFTHMFFYLTLFKGFVFQAKYPVFVFMFVICIPISMLVNAIYQPIRKRINLLA